jgi:hypothetical protein
MRILLIMAAALAVATSGTQALGATIIRLPPVHVWNSTLTAVPPNPTLLYSTLSEPYRLARVRAASGRELTFQDGALCLSARWGESPLSVEPECDPADRAEQLRVLKLDVAEPGSVTLVFEAPNKPPHTVQVTIDPAARPPRTLAYEVHHSTINGDSHLLPRRVCSSTTITIREREIPLRVRPLAYAYEVRAGPGETSGGGFDAGGVTLARLPYFRNLTRASVVRVTPLWYTGRWGTPWEGRPYDLVNRDIFQARECEDA